MKILDTDPTAAALYRGCCAAPADDLARLVLADRLEETDDPRHRDLAQFIRTQFALEELGPPRPVLEVTLLRPHGGSDYFAIDEDPAVVPAVGARVDVEPFTLGHNRTLQKKAQPRAPGLVVVRKGAPDSLGIAEIILKRDAGSTPYPAAERDRLTREAHRLFQANYPYWADPLEVRVLYPNGTGQFRFQADPAGSAWAPVTLDLVRGLPSRWSGPWAAWTGLGMCFHFPLMTVSFSDPPPLARYNDPDNRRWVYRFSAHGPQHLVSHAAEASSRVSPEERLRTVRLVLLKQTWPTVATWTFPD